MERKFTKKIVFMILVAVISVFAFAGVSNAAQTPLTLDSLDGFSDISGSSTTTTTTTNTTTNTTTTNTANNTVTNNATQSNTKIPQTGSNSIVYFISGLVVLATVSIISISLYSRIKLS